MAMDGRKDAKEKGKPMQFDDFDVNSVTMSPHNSPGNKVGEIQYKSGSSK